MGDKSDSGDYKQAAIAQGEANREVVRDQTFANRVNQQTPWGTTQWNPFQTVDPSTGEAVTAWEQVTALRPELQGILDKQLSIQNDRSDIAGNLTGRVGTEFNEAMDWSNLSPWASRPQVQQTLGEGPLNNPYQTRAAAEDAVYNQAMSRIQPRFDSQRQQLEIKMRNQGLSPGDEAWDSQMQSLGQQQNDATNQAMWSANQAGRDEAGQMFGMDLSSNQNAFQQALQANNQNFGQMLQSANYGNTLRQAQTAEAMQQRGFSLNEINALLSGQQVGMPQMPSFSQASAAQAAPIYQGQADAASTAAAMSPWNALIGAGGTAAGGFLSTL